MLICGWRSGYYDIVLTGGTEVAAKMERRWRRVHLPWPATAAMNSPRYYLSRVFAATCPPLLEKIRYPAEQLKRQMAQVSVNSHYYGARNPKAQIRKEITMDDVLNSFMVATPYPAE